MKNERIRTAAVILICLLLVIFTWQFKYRQDYNYRDSNATWHVLLTMQAYEETPAAVHHFLPIVSLGKELDKGIPWAEMVSDEAGNYYYTSFSPAEFVAPYLFIKIFHLPIEEHSLYLFNTFLCCLSLLLSMAVYREVFGKYIKKEYIYLLTTLFYVFQPEIMQGLGAVYWAQSLMQVLLPLQFLLVLRFDRNRIYKLLFFAACLVTPYVEWTGCIANVGFAIYLFLKDGKRISWKNVLWVVIDGVASVASLGLFVLHYITVIPWASVKQALVDRFMMRTEYASPSTFELLWGYWKSFRYLWIVCILLVILCCIAYRGIKWIGKIWFAVPALFIMLFPVLENLVMKDHAISYTYDRMKLGFFLVGAVLTMAVLLQEKIKYFQPAIIAVGAILAILNLNQYTGDTNSLWSAPYRESNRALAAYCEETYGDDSVYGLDNAAVRGYVNILFQRGVYENISQERLVELAKERGARYAVLLHAENEPDPANCWNMYAFRSVKVYDTVTGEESEYSID